MRERYWKGGTRTQREPDTLHRILRTTFSGDRQCKIRLQTIARLWRDPHHSPGSPPPLSYLVPWLAAQGPLAHSPVEPPARDYFFQYSWILPGIFDPKANLREHRYVGRYRKGSSKFLFDFWGSARKGCGAALQQYCEPGLFSDAEVEAPLAAYHHVRKYYNMAG